MRASVSGAVLLGFGLGSALTTLAGCGVATRAAVPVDEYATYRRFRFAPTVERKLARGYDYLQANPAGTFRPEVKAWFSIHASQYVTHFWGEQTHLEAFLKCVPKGAEAERAAARLVELELAADYRAKHDRAFDEHVAKIEGRLAEAEVGRRELVSGVARWVRRLVGIHSWGGRTSELDSDFIYEYRLREPGAHCGDDACAKTVMVPYAVPEGKVQSPREAIYDVGLRLEKGGVAEAWMTGPELFTRLGEAVRVAAISSSDWVGRAEAIGQAASMLALSVEPLLPAARCAVDAVSPVVLHRKCDGVELRVISAIELGDEDRIVISPVK